MTASASPALSRKDWILACGFHPHSPAELFALLHSEIASRRRPSVLLDLDSTLYEVAPRNRTILRMAALDLASRIPADVASALARVDIPEIGYSLRDTFRALGLSFEHAEVESAWGLVKEYWWERFFSNEFLREDNPYPGAVERAQELHAAGMDIVYLTGRERAKMELGTIANLGRDGFPVGARTSLIMKEVAGLDDMTHKVQAGETLTRGGHDIIASFENEPRNLVGLFHSLPNSHHVFVETVCSDHPAAACRGIYRLGNFDLSAS